MPSRPLASLAVALLLFVAGGAACPHMVRQYVEPVPPVFSERPTLDEVIAEVNRQSSQIHSFRGSNAKIDLEGVRLAPTLKADVVYEQPGRFRLKARSPIADEVDLGSNDELFWVWVRMNDPKEMYWCRHDRFDDSPARQLIPVEPGWLIEALGVVHLDPRGEHRGPYPTKDGRLEIETRIRTPLGDLTKVTVLDDRRGWVLQQRLFDAHGKLLASAVGRKHYSVSVDGDPSHRVALPKEVRIEWPPAKLSMTLDLGELEINPRDLSPELWTKPTYKGWRDVDLGGMRRSHALPTVPRGGSSPVPK